jgi:hypothetical protein
MFRKPHTVRALTAGISALAVALSTQLPLGSAFTSPASAASSTNSLTLVTGGTDIGTHGFVQWVDATGTTFGLASVDATGSARSPQTALSYVIFTCASFACTVDASGFGFIPNQDLMGSATGKLRLNTDTCANPSFSTFDGACGVVGITWEKNLFETFQTTSTTQDTSGPFHFTSTGHFKGSFASVSGSVVGVPIGTPLTSVIEQVTRATRTIQRLP